MGSDWLGTDFRINMIGSEWISIRNFYQKLLLRNRLSPVKSFSVSFQIFFRRIFFWKFYYDFADRQSDVSTEHIPGPADAAENLETIEQFWEILFTDQIIQVIVEQTNKKIKEVCTPLVVENKAETYHHHTDAEEIRAYIGVLYFAGLWKSSQVNDIRLWNKINGITVYRCVFSRHRFTFLSACLHFDNKDTRDDTDRFAPIREVWNIFIANFQRYYTASNKCTVDEQLLDFRGRCPFRTYMKDEPDKYGLKLTTLNDAETSYLVNIFLFQFFVPFFMPIFFIIHKSYNYGIRSHLKNYFEFKTYFDVSHILLYSKYSLFR